MNAERDHLIRPREIESAESLGTEAPLAEEFGYHRISMSETTNCNVVPLLAVIASEAKSIGISDDGISPFSRSLVLLAQTALTLHEISDWPDANGIWHGPDDE